MNQRLKNRGYVSAAELDKRLIEIMKQKDYDGLNPSQIRLILSEVFRIKANLAAISMALINDKHYTENKLSTVIISAKVKLIHCFAIFGTYCCCFN